MDYEEKYKEALERAKKINNEQHAQPFDVMTRVFPELKESEDERIRKELIDFVKSRLAGFPQCEKFISWLEKQGEHTNFRNKIQVGDKVTRNEAGILVNLSQLERVAKPRKAKPADKVKSKFSIGDEIKIGNEESLTITKIDEKSYWSEDLFICSFEDSTKWELVEKLVDKVEPNFNFKVGQWIVATGECVYLIAKIDGFNVTLVDTNGDEYVFDASSLDDAHQWTLTDTKDGDVLVCKGDIKGSNGIKYERICLFKNLDSAFFTLTKTSNYIEEYDIDVNIDYPDNTVPATKEQKEILFMAMTDAGYTFDFEKKELKKIEQKLADKPKFKVKYAGSEYNVFKIKDIAGVTFYGIEDEPNHIDYVKADNCEIISGYGIKESGLSIPTKPVMFSEQKTAWSEEDDYNLQCIIAKVTSGIQKGNVGRNQELIDWLNSLKDRVQPKVEWSEEDELNLNQAIYVCHQNGYDGVEKWLKSLRPQNRWKPSEEQLGAIDEAIAICSERYYEIECRLDNLRQDLKKLMEE